MVFTEMEISIIKQKAQFLENLGYTRTEDKYSIDYTSKDICISFAYPPCTNERPINICFISKNKYYYIGWMALVRENIQNKGDRISYIKEILDYMENHYFQIIDEQYCEESDLLIKKYVEEHKEIFEEARQKFLREHC